MLNFNIMNDNKSIYFIEPNTQWFWTVEVLCKTSQIAIFSYNVLSNKIKYC